MKKFLKTFVICLSLFSLTLLSSKRSSAVVGLGTGSVPLIDACAVGAGAFLVGPAACLIIGGEKVCDIGLFPAELPIRLINLTGVDGVVSVVGGVAASIALGIAGVVILDNKQGASAKFEILTNDQRSMLKVDHYDHDVYESELDEVNAVSDSISKNILSSTHLLQKNFVQIKAMANQAWAKTCQNRNLSPETCRVVQRIRNQKK